MGSIVISGAVNGHDRPSGTRDASSEETADSAGVTAPAPWMGGGDPLSDVLETIRLRSALFFAWEPGWHYATGVPPGDRLAAAILPDAERIISYHIVTEGPCWGAVPDEEPIRLESGDILLLPHGDAYCIASRPHPASNADDPQALEFFRLMAAGKLPAVVVDGGEGPERNRLICGFLGYDRQPFNPLLDTLPRLLRVPARSDADDPLARLIGFALSESHRGLAGERCLLTRLSEVMFVEVLRRYMHTVPADRTGWLAGLRDPLVGRALGLLHRRPAEPWTLAGLAGELATSRSTLAERFAALVGEPPMQYLTRWRMQLAARWLSDRPDKVYTVAHDAGYESEAAFSRAFKRATGLSPRAWRERQRASRPDTVARVTESLEHGK